MTRPFDRVGGRRFVMCMGCAMVCTVLVWFAKISGGEFTAIILGTVAAYIAGNTGQKVWEPKGENKGGRDDQLG